MRVIPNFSRYKVDEFGNIYSTNYKNSGKTKILKPAKSNDGYLKTMLQRDDGKYKSMTVHYFITLAYFGEKPSNIEVNHKNGIKTDNRLSNLEYVTRSENVKHAFDLGLAKPAIGSKNGWAKLTEQDVVDIRNHVRNSKTRYYGRKELADKYSISEGHLKKIVNCKNTWKHVLV